MDTYTKPPKLPKASGSKLVPIGAGLVAAAAGLAWHYAPRAAVPKAAAVPAAPATEPGPAMPQAPARKAAAAPAPVATIRVDARQAEVRGEEAREAKKEGVPPESASRTAAVEPPAWVKRGVSQEWTWPRRIEIAGESGVGRKLVGWYPANAANRRLRYALTVDRVETRLYEDEIPGFENRLMLEEVERKQGQEARRKLEAQQAMAAMAGGAGLKAIQARELAALRAHKGATSARDVSTAGSGPMAEFTYADGRKEVVPYDPLVFDLKGGGIKTSPKKVLFDLYGYGKSDKTQWMNDLEEGTGILVFDATGSGRSGKNGGEVFGDRTDLTGVGQPSGFADGFEALRALVRKAVDAGVLRADALDQGVLDAAALASLEKAYGLKMKLGGFNRESVSLEAAGIKAIALSQEPTLRALNFDGQANDLLVQPGAVFLRRDGTTGSYMNVWLVAKRGNLGLKTGAP